MILIMQDLTKSEKLRQQQNMESAHRKMVTSITNIMSVPIETINEGINVLITGEKDQTKSEILKTVSKSCKILMS